MKTIQAKYEKAITVIEQSATLISKLQAQNKELRQALADIVYSEGKDWTLGKSILVKSFNEKPEVFRGYSAAEQKALKKDIINEMREPKNVLNHIELDAWFKTRDLALQQGMMNSPMKHVINYRWKMCLLEDKQSYFDKYNKCVKA